MVLRDSRILAFLIALSAACGGGEEDEGIPPQYVEVPGPNAPQPPAQRELSAEGEVTITPATGTAASATLLTKVETPGPHSGSETGFRLSMACGATLAESEVSLYFSHGPAILVIAMEGNRWTVNRQSAEVVPAQSAEVADAGDGDAGDAGVPPPNEVGFVNGIGLPAVDGTRKVAVTLVADGVRYDVRATVPWLASVAPATCQQLKPGTGTKGSGGGCGSGNSSRRSSGGDWD